MPDALKDPDPEEQRSLLDRLSELLVAIGWARLFG